jgi:hypothetical protein
LSGGEDRPALTDWVFLLQDTRQGFSLQRGLLIDALAHLKRLQDNGRGVSPFWDMWSEQVENVLEAYEHL